ncbi:MAG: hypothetical protein EOM50_24115 [Erysipelotrichia bacterium]|nr:hypothetical protein [Erysipelotrichia bacterium]
MIELKLSDKKTLNMSVNKAHKVLSVLQKAENDKKNDLNLSKHSSKYSDTTSANTFVFDYATIVSSTEDELKMCIQSHVQKRVTTFLSAIELLEDIKDLKEAIFSFNVQKGISEKLSYIEKKKHLLKLYEHLNKKAHLANDTLQSVASKLVKLSQSEFERNEEIEVAFQYWDNDTLLKELKTIKETMLRYEDEILTLNATHQISVSLYQNSIDMIGL